MTQIHFDEQDNVEIRRNRIVLAVVVLVLAALVYLGYRQFTAISSVTVRPDSTTAVDMLPPPPPPPPPPELKQPPPEPSTSPEPTPEPTPQMDQPQEVKMDAQAQAGTDAYGIGAGKGGGMGAPGGGNCLGSNCGPSGGVSDAFYTRYLSGELQQRIQDESRVNRFVFSADFAIWISPSGAVTKVELVKGSGDNRRDSILTAVLGGVRGLDAPPSSLRFPQRITVRGRRSL